MARVTAMMSTMTAPATIPAMNAFLMFMLPPVRPKPLVEPDARPTARGTGVGWGTAAITMPGEPGMQDEQLVQISMITCRNARKKSPENIRSGQFHHGTVSDVHA
jgi:hypothetical protein